MSLSSSYTEEELLPRLALQQRYVIVEQIGRGGMGAVYRAIDTRLSDRRVAIKELSQAHQSHERRIYTSACFQQEILMLASLSHTNLPHLYDVFSDQGNSYLVTEYIEGKTLYQLLQEAEGKPLPLTQVLLYAHQLCDVLNYLHQHDPPIIFRDVKPTNIMIADDGHIYLIDFGIARFFKEGQVQDTILLGSPGYAPPEQHGLAQTSPRSDIYGLGATLHYCLTGHPPYAILHDQFTFPPVSQYNPQVPPEMEQLIESMLAIEELERPASALEVQQVLLKIRHQALEHTNLIDTALETTLLLSAHTVRQRIIGQSAITAAPSTQKQNSTGHALLTDTSAPNNTGSRVRFWTGGFTAVFVLLLVLAVASSVLSFNFVCSSAHILEAGITLLVVLNAFFASAIVRGVAARNILWITGLITLISSFTFFMQAQPDIPLLHVTMPTSADCVARAPTFAEGWLYNQLITGGLVGVGLVSLYWPISQSGRATRAFLFMISCGVIACSIFQFFQEEMSSFKHILLQAVLIALLGETLLVAQIGRIPRRAPSLVR